MVKNVITGFTGEIDFSKDGIDYSLTVFPDTLNSFFGKNVVESYYSFPVDLEDRILSLENIDVTYSASKLPLHCH